MHGFAETISLMGFGAVAYWARAWFGRNGRFSPAEVKDTTIATLPRGFGWKLRLSPRHDPCNFECETALGWPQQKGRSLRLSCQ